MSPLAHDSVSLDPEDLLRFLAVADAGSFQAAADRLLVDRSVLSRRVAALEKALGVRLLRRSTRSLSLTEAGSAIAVRARKLQSLLDEVQQIADDTQ
ncbi:LysR family transcriptional regulator [Diaphorobacter sp. HDW4B]|uniref:LysR family transcriptional regulator n=1 Tax=Diaphorobacter sp. HDW4B TaxID=2714925 RepID=UPI001409290E|nr:LysR family transcriptional regulator [Diaphorobacter sp. HDW4B]QIL69193.1 LysR family transcriptional regulator [Diaphorobacter sp. HDW4B]